VLETHRISPVSRKRIGSLCPQRLTALLVGGGDPFYLCYYWMRQSDWQISAGASADGLCGGERRGMVLTPIPGSNTMASIARSASLVYVVMLEQADRQTGSDRAAGLV